MKKRILIVVGLAILYFVLAKVGIMNRYNYITAKVDIASDIQRIIVFEKTETFNLQLKDRIMLNEKYGFYYSFKNKKNLPKLYLKGVSSYNNVMLSYLESKNGKNWMKNYERDIDSLLILNGLN